MGIFWLWRQISQIGLLVAPSYSRHVLFGTLLGVCWGVNVVFAIKIEREMAIFQGRMKKWNWCLCQFRPFFFFLTFTGGNPWPNTVPANPFGMKSGVFFLPGNWKSLFIDIVQLYLDRIFLFFASSFHESFKFFWIERSADIQEYHKEHVAIKKWRFFYFFCRLSWNVLCSIHLKLLKWSKF